MRPMRHIAARDQRGMTLIEIVIVVALLGLVSAGVTVSFRSVQRARTRESAMRLAAAIRYLYDRAIVGGGYYRLAIDLDGGSYQAQRSDDRFYLNSDKERGPGRGKAFDQDAETKKLDQADEDARRNTVGLARELQPPPAPKRAHFQSFKDAMLPRVELKNAWVRDLYTPRQEEPYTSGRAFLYFFPDGRTERAVIHVVSGDRPGPDEDADPDADVYTLIVHPLTGRVEFEKGDLEVPRDFDTTDDEGNTEAGR